MKIDGEAGKVVQINRRKKKQLSQSDTSAKRLFGENNMFPPDCVNPPFLYFSKE